MGADGQVDDHERVACLEQHLAACARAVRHGVPPAGYCAWSLLDNVEWADGYDKRSGLVHVDRATQKRTVKGSGRRYAENPASAPPQGTPRGVTSGVPLSSRRPAVR